MRRSLRTPLPSPATLATLAWTLAVVGCGGVGRAPAAPAADSLPGGSWQIGARLESGALLVGDAASGGRVPVMRWGPDVAPRIETAGIIDIALPRGTRSDPVGLGRWEAPDGPVLFGVPGGSPPLLPLAPGSDRSILEAGGTLWIVAADGRVSLLVADTANGLERLRLERLQREGEVILYWATVPVPSPGGDRVAFATNREAVDRTERGQSIWLVDVVTGRERPLLAEPGQWFRPEAWLGDELLFTGGFPGIRAVDPSTGGIRPIGEGILVDVAPVAPALAEAVGVPDSTRVRVLRGAEWAEVPLPPDPAGMTYIPQGSFAPDGRRLLLQASTPDGMTRRFAIYDLDSEGVRWLDAPVPPVELDAWPRWLDAETLLFTTTGRRGRGSGEGASWAVRVP